MFFGRFRPPRLLTGPSFFRLAQGELQLDRRQVEVVDGQFIQFLFQHAVASRPALPHFPAEVMTQPLFIASQQGGNLCRGEPGRGQIFGINVDQWLR